MTMTVADLIAQLETITDKNRPIEVHLLNNPVDLDYGEVESVESQDEVVLIHVGLTG